MLHVSADTEGNCLVHITEGMTELDKLAALWAAQEAVRNAIESVGETMLPAFRDTLKTHVEAEG